ncbi:MAG: formylglycine-generating enzyme family protein [Bacteroidota bacterium]
MPKSTTTFFLALISLSAFAQKSALSLEKLGLKHLQGQLSYIPTKTFTSLAHTGNDSMSHYKSRNSSVAAFYISRTEVTNKEYRAFVLYVRDSIAHTLLSHFLSGTDAVDWSREIDWEDKRLEQMMTPVEDRFAGRKEIDPDKIVYTMKAGGQQQTISIYPDTLVWIRDFSYSYNEPLVKKYFSHKEYDDHPIVGVSRQQAIAFCQWKTIQVSRSMKEAVHAELSVRLPSNAEWESAAFETKDTTVHNVKSRHYLYNFGNIIDGNRKTIKTYKDDGFFYTGPVKSYPAGVYGLFDIKGNVSEWTSTAMEEVMNAEMKEAKVKSIFVVKGGGWNSTPFYLQAGVCQFFAADAAHSYIGFRYVVSIKTR